MDRPRHTQDLGRTHLFAGEKHASGAFKPRRAHLVSASQGSAHTCLHLLSSTASVGGAATSKISEHPLPAHHVQPTRRSKQRRRMSIPSCTSDQRDPFASSMTDLWDHLNKKRRADRVAPH